MISHGLIKNENAEGELKWPCYAKFSVRNEKEFRYVMGSAYIYGEDYLNESFRVLKEKEISGFGECRANCLVLEKWKGMKR